MTPAKTTTTRVLLTALWLLAALALTGCDGHGSDIIGGAGSSGITGTVVHRNTTGKTWWLIIRDDHGARRKVFVRGGTYRSCHKGERYPQCARRPR